MTMQLQISEKYRFCICLQGYIYLEIFLKNIKYSRVKIWLLCILNVCTNNLCKLD